MSITETINSPVPAGAARLCIGLGFLIASLLVAAPLHAQSTSPGPLARSHAEIDGAGKCGKCHEPGGAPTDKLCLECHAEARRSRYHSKMAKDSGKACSKCHRDHHGRDFQMIRWRPARNFNHRKTGYGLDGRHKRLACVECHTRSHRWMGLQSACASCHKDPHVPTLGQECANCHTEQGFVPARRFQHDRARFKLRGRHAQVGCDQCHAGGGAEARYRGLDFRSCKSCHADPVPGHSAGLACEGCHTETSWAKTTRQSGLDLHRRSRLPLRGAHVRVDCNRCHRERDKGGPSAALRLARFRGLNGDCASCHRDQHRGQFGNDCASCHTEDSWRVRSKKGFDHAKTGWPLQGRHRRVACARCHVSKGSYKKRFAAVRHDRCDRCHKDPHGGPFPSVKSGDRCETCHSVSGFLPAAYGVAEHERAALPLAGAHRVVACRRCHEPVAVAPSKQVVARLRGTAKACRDCHKDVHGGQFARRKPPLDCTHCHSDRSFAERRFDHATSRFPLKGAHAAAKCAGCHFRPAKGEAVQFGGTNTQCSGCHADVHRGQFAIDGPRRDCADCHDIVSKFRIPGYDHGKTRFALTGRHISVACTDCHREQALPGGKAAVHYRLGQMTCAQCHANPHKDGKGRASAAPAGTWTCARCHQTQAWNAVANRVEFDHRVTGVPLTGAHGRAACAGCHNPQRRSGPLPRQCVGCHSDPHRDELGQRCDRCHTSRSWQTPQRFVDHRGSRFPLTGAHAMVACRSCHSRQGRDTWRGTPNTCDACHQNQALVVQAFDHTKVSVGCNRCHSTFAWAPARLDHNLWWPLVGRHKAVQSNCAGCHTGGSFASASRACATCHSDLVSQGKTHPDHKALGFSPSCDKCHTPYGWKQLLKTWHEGYFPLAGGDHARYANNCQSCHPTGMGAGRFDCIHCHDGAHSKSKMDSEHEGKSGYQWHSPACLQCHPGGEE